MMTLGRWGFADNDLVQLSRLAGRFHQDFDLEHLSVREAIKRHIRFITPGELETLRREATLVLSRIPSEDEFEKFFVAAGAEDWPDGEGPGAVIEEWLAEKA